MNDDLAALLRDALGALDEAGLDRALIGGCARNAYAEPRATKDVDLVVEVDESKLATFEAALARRGFTAATRVGAAGGVPDLALYRDAAGRRVDVLFAHTDFEREALARSRAGTPFAGITLPVVTAEDLIVYKVLADRPQDRADVHDVVRAVRARGHELDWSRVEAWCDAWEVRPRLERLRAELDA